MSQEAQNNQEYKKAAKSALDVRGGCTGNGLRNSKAWQKKILLPQVKGTWEAYLTFALAICTQFYVIIYNMIELKCEFAIATQASNGAYVAVQNYSTSLKRSKEWCSV